MILKFMYRSIFFKVFITDMMYWLLFIEKSKNLHENDLKHYE